MRLHPGIPARFAMAVLALATLGCSARRREGDPEGTWIPFRVTVDEAFFSRMADHHATAGVGVGQSFHSGGGSLFGVGMGIGFQGTTVYLLGGDHPGEASVFRRKLSWGDNHFAVPLIPGRHLVLTVQAEGGRQGWETVGEFTVGSPDADQVDLKVGAQGAVLTLH